MIRTINIKPHPEQSRRVFYGLQKSYISIRSLSNPLNITGLILVLSIFFLLAGCKSFKEVECTGVKGFKVNKINTQGLDADIMLGIKNPNATGFSIYRSEFDVVFNGINLGKAKLTKRVHINANAEKTYAFNLKSDFKNINMMEIMKLVNGMGGRGMIEVKGDLKAGKLFIRKKFPVNIKERLEL